MCNWLCLYKYLKKRERCTDKHVFFGRIVSKCRGEPKNFYKYLNEKTCATQSFSWFQSRGWGLQQYLYELHASTLLQAVELSFVSHACLLVANGESCKPGRDALKLTFMAQIKIYNTLGQKQKS